MSLLKKLLGLASEAQSNASGSAGDTETVRRIVGELESMEPQRARFLGAFAYVMGRVAHADLDISQEETRKMEQIVRELGHVPEDQAVLVVQIAKSQNRLFGGTESYLVTREFKQIATPEQCRELLDCLFAVSAADESISTTEENQIRQIASELGFSHQQYVSIRAAYSDKRAVLKDG
jgi:uncharacterized tellurite resistance protein B-like protein